jgi:hypothetical protein
MAQKIFIYVKFSRCKFMVIRYCKMLPFDPHIIQCEKKQCDTKEVDIFPPGLGIDFWNYEVGTDEYEERFTRMLMFNTKGR